MSRNGNVLIPTDSAGRVFEITQVLYNHWRKNNLFQKFTLAFLSNTSKHSIEAIRSMLEWMNEDCRRKFDEDRKNVFKWSKIIIARNLQELQSQAQEPMCVLATNPHCQNGFSKALLRRWCQKPSNCVLLTERVSPNTIAGQLFDIIEKRKAKGKNIEQKISFQTRRKVALDGEELEAFQEKQRLKKKRRKG
eukprot:UN28004